uniref:Uncharacterized protein n=1 Tax=Romanomermis culicivorax TaxID=13658 RepID=A0A915JMT5_ROMCU
MAVLGYAVDTAKNNDYHKAHIYVPFDCLPFRSVERGKYKWPFTTSAQDIQCQQLHTLRTPSHHTTEQATTAENPTDLLTPAVAHPNDQPPQTCRITPHHSKATVCPLAKTSNKMCFTGTSLF